MKKIVILKGGSIETTDDFILETCLAIMFPECEIEIQFTGVSERAEKNSETKKNGAAL